VKLLEATTRLYVKALMEDGDAKVKHEEKTHDA
jgi:hypothetical protein